ncbi:hypothetical protein PLESTB_001160300 [Pleodorina starrii]|uniref:Uncharacterized protein n=1 Tax=Pleodorina starrii TaxID=330485 RepID=A0A9W6BR45_9CHLO|nr:hypothetical protein PLESTB_001160300 [Pleodorina starrii]
MTMASLSMNSCSVAHGCAGHARTCLHRVATPAQVLHLRAASCRSYVTLSAAGQHRPATRSLVMARASDNGPGAFGNDASSDLVFICKIAGISFAGAAAIKYGSLVMDIPFQANAILAMSLVLGPPIAYAALLWRNSPPKP